MTHRCYLDLCWSPGRECSLPHYCLSFVVAAYVVQTTEMMNWGNGPTLARWNRTSSTSEPRDTGVVRATLVCGRARCGYWREGREAIGRVDLGAATCRASYSLEDRKGLRCHTSLRCLEADVWRRCILSRRSLQRRRNGHDKSSFKRRCDRCDEPHYNSHVGDRTKRVARSLPELSSSI